MGGITKAYWRLYIHLNWCTPNHRMLIPTSLLDPFEAELERLCREHQIDPLCVGAVESHVHVLASLRPNMSVSHAIGILKGKTSRWLDDHIPGHTFTWGTGYGATTVSPMRLDVVRAYVANQRVHHALRGQTPVKR